jgi:hypothetical protein
LKSRGIRCASPRSRVDEDERMSKIVEPLEFELRRHAKAMDRAFANDPQVTEVSNAIIKFRAGAGGLLTVTDRIGFCPESRGAKFYREAHKALTDFEAEAKLLRDE